MELEIKNRGIDLFCGNCLDIMPGLPENSVDLIAVDPPYGTTQNKRDIVIPLSPMWDCIRRVLKRNGTVVMTSAQPFTSQLIMSNLLWYKYDIIWEKTIGSGQLNIRRQPLRAHEHIVVFYDKYSVYNEQKTEGPPYTIRRKAAGFGGNYGKQKDSNKNNTGYRHAKSVITIPNPRTKGGHCNEKPVALMEYIIKTYSNEGDTVLDFAMGRGTTGIACVNLGRSFIGIEEDTSWFLKAEERIKEHKCY